jgi:hypothetical protein
VDVRVCFPETLTLSLTEAQAKALEDRLHRAVENVLAPLFDFPKPYTLTWKGKGPMPHAAVGTVVVRTPTYYVLTLTREDIAWLCDDWSFNDNWELAALHT